MNNNKYKHALASIKIFKILGSILIIIAVFGFLGLAIDGSWSLYAIVGEIVILVGGSLTYAMGEVVQCIMHIHQTVQDNRQNLNEIKGYKQTTMGHFDDATNYQIIDDNE